MKNIVYKILSLYIFFFKSIVPVREPWIQDLNLYPISGLKP